MCPICKQPGAAWRGNLKEMMHDECYHLYMTKRYLESAQHFFDFVLKQYRYLGVEYLELRHIQAAIETALEKKKPRHASCDPVEE